jgi:adenylate kinase family enzyme
MSALLHTPNGSTAVPTGSFVSLLDSPFRYRVLGRLLKPVRPIGSILRLHLMGRPGVGKSTQLRLLEAHGFTGLDTSVILNDIDDSSVKSIIASYKQRRQRVPDKYVIPYVEQATFAVQGNSVIAGYPRSIDQGISSVESHAKQREYAVYVEFVLDREICRQRLLRRWVCDSRSCNGRAYSLDADAEKVCTVCGAMLIQRHDDTPEGINERFEDYDSYVDDLRERLVQCFDPSEEVGAYSDQGAYIQVCAAQDSVSQVREILAFTNQVMGRPVFF